MKKQILSLMKYSLLCTVLLSTAAVAMDPPQIPSRTRRALPTPQGEPNLPSQQPYAAGNIPQIEKQETECKTLSSSYHFPILPMDLSQDEDSSSTDCFSLQNNSVISQEEMELISAEIDNMIIQLQEKEENEKTDNPPSQQPSSTGNIFQIEELKIWVPLRAPFIFPTETIEEQTDCKTVNYPLPPVVTYGDLVSTLMLGHDIDGWGNITGTISSWLQNPENKTSLIDQDGVDLEDLIFFNENFPYIDEETQKLKCLYSLPGIVQENEPYFYLYHDASPEQIAAVEELELPPVSDFFFQRDSWVKDFKARQAFTRAVETSSPEMMSETFIPFLSHQEDSFYISYPDEQNNSCNFIYLNFDHKDNVRNTQTYFSNNGFKMDMPSINKGLSLRSLSSLANHDKGNKKELSSLFCPSTNRLNLRSQSININNCLFSNSFTSIHFNKIVLQEAYFKARGGVEFFPYFTGCPIEKIRICPANNGLPICIKGTVKFTAKPKINLHMLNVETIEVKYKEN